MPREWTFRIRDIIQAAEKIGRYIQQLDFAGFEQDAKTTDAVLRNLTIIGEAAGSIPIEVQEEYPGIPWDEMRRMRNIVVHVYFGVSLPIVWRTATQDVPGLVEPLRAILSEHDSVR